MTENKAIANIAQQKLDYLLKLQDGSQKALLAELRRGVGHKPGALPKLWGILLEQLPDSMTAESGAPTPAEWALYTALTLFALHQQGRDPLQQPMHQPGQGLGRAMACLIKDNKEEERILRRFNCIATSGSIEELAHHLRGTVQLLRNEGVGMDYAALAQDLYQYQNIRLRDRVRLKWGQDFYRALPYQTEKGENDDV